LAEQPRTCGAAFSIEAGRTTGNSEPALPGHEGLSPTARLSGLWWFIAPPLRLLTILFLGSQRPLPNATAFVLGYFTTCTVMGIAGLTHFDETERAANTVRRRQVRVLRDPYKEAARPHKMRVELG
jgi:hypothetical protein